MVANEYGRSSSQSTVTQTNTDIHHTKDKDEMEFVEEETSCGCRGGGGQGQGGGRGGKGEYEEVESDLVRESPSMALTQLVENLKTLILIKILKFIPIRLVKRNLINDRVCP